jgi:hypothetical protein
MSEHMYNAVATVLDRVRIIEADVLDRVRLLRVMFWLGLGALGKDGEG